MFQDPTKLGRRGATPSHAHCGLFTKCRFRKYLFSSLTSVKIFVQFISKNICSHKRDDDLVRHEDVDADVDEEGERSAGLGDDEEVDDGVHDAGSHKQSATQVVNSETLIF